MAGKLRSAGMEGAAALTAPARHRARSANSRRSRNRASAKGIRVPGWSDKLMQSRNVTSRNPDMAQRIARRYDIVDEVSPLPGEAVIRKAAPSGFFGTLLMAHLNSLDRLDYPLR